MFQTSTELSHAFDDRPLLFATLGGGMVAVEPLTGNIIWKLKDGKFVFLVSFCWRTDFFCSAFGSVIAKPLESVALIYSMD